MPVAAPLRPFVIDCDTGRDDALALALALQSAAPLVGVVATYGNVPQTQVYANCADVLSFLGAERVPLFAGNSQPSNPAAVTAMLSVRQNAAGNGLCNLTLPLSARRALPKRGEDSVMQLAEGLEKLAAQYGALDYVILGPATTAAVLLRHWGAKAQSIIARLTMMGGKLDALWQSAPVADFNLACDPFAVADILAQDIPLRFVPINVTWPVVLTVSELEALRPQHARAEFFQQLMLAHARHFAPEPVFRFHDPTVILALATPDEFLPVALTIGCGLGSDFARLMASTAGHPAFVMRTTAAQPANFLAELLSRLGLDQPA